MLDLTRYHSSDEDEDEGDAQLVKESRSLVSLMSSKLPARVFHYTNSLVVRHCLRTMKTLSKTPTIA